MSSAKYWERKLSRFEYNMKYSNMDNDTALDIVQELLSEILTELEDEGEYSPVEGMLSRVYDHVDTIRLSRRK